MIRYRDIPYLIHTNRELGLMLRGAKPLARFSGCHGHDPECLLRYIRMFDRHVALGRFVRAELSEPVPQRPQLTGWTVFYALPGEEWRIGVMIELFERPGPWSDEREREEGALLGYQDWQNDWWITYLQRQGGQGYASQPKPAEDLA